MPRAFLAWAAPLLTVAACTAIVDQTSEQCEVTADCAALGANLMCNALTKTCEDPSVGAGGAPGTGGEGEGGNGVTPGECTTPSSTDNIVELRDEIASDFTLQCDRNYLLTGRVFVQSGATLTIEAGTHVFGNFAPDAAPRDVASLIVTRGGQIVANGTAEQPIVFTSARSEGERRPGDWGGVVLLGRAPVNIESPSIEGLEQIAEAAYGGDEPADSSGTMRYVRIEYAGVEIAPNNELNGLTLGGVGTGTTIDFIQVRGALDDCFEFFGGTVNAKHLICQHNEDDGIDWDLGWRGSVQYAVVQQKPDPIEDDEANGIEADGESDADDPDPSFGRVHNLTLIGRGPDDQGTLPQIGMVFRERTRAEIRNAIVYGFEVGYDVRENDGMADFTLEGVVFQGNPMLVEPLDDDNDDGFDERSFFENGSGNRFVDGSIFAGDPFDANDPGFFPATSLTEGAFTTAAGGFIEPASYIGAFEDADDRWDQPWAVWSDE